MKLFQAAIRFPADCIRLRSVSRAWWVLQYRMEEGRA